MSASAKTNGAGAPQGAVTGAARRAARLGAVQALYQIELSGGPAETVLGEFLEYRLAEEIEGVSLGAADRNLFAGLVRGVAAERAPLDGGEIIFGRDPDDNLIGLQTAPTDALVSSRNFKNNGME